MSAKWQRWCNSCEHCRYVPCFQQFCPLTSREVREQRKRPQNDPPTSDIASTSQAVSKTQVVSTNSHGQTPGSPTPATQTQTTTIQSNDVASDQSARHGDTSVVQTANASVGISKSIRSLRKQHPRMSGRTVLTVDTTQVGAKSVIK